MNINQPYEIGLNYVNINGGGPFILGPDLVTGGISKRMGPSGNYGGGLAASGSATSMVASAGGLWGVLGPGGIWAAANAGSSSGGFQGNALNAGILTWQPGSANAGNSYYFYYAYSTRTFTLATSLANTVVAGDAFIITTVYGQVRWRLKQMTIEYVSGTVTGFSITDTKASASIMSGGAIISGPPLSQGPCDSNNGLCETINYGYGMKMTLTGTTPSISGSVAVEACGPLWATGDNLNN